MIAMSEGKENEVHDYSHLSKKGWADYLFEQGFQITWLESVMDSMVLILVLILYDLALSSTYRIKALSSLL